MYYFILNPSSHSRGSRSVWKQVSSILKARGTEYKVFASRHAGQAREIAARVSERDPEATIVAVGGDGTIHDILCGIRNVSTIRFGVIPSGSGNDFARGMGISQDPGKALAAILDPRETLLMDVGCLTDRERPERFGVSAGIGYDASVCHEALSSPIKNTLNSIGFGNLTYGLIAAKQIVMYEPGRLSVSLDGKAPIRFEGAYFAAVFNQRFEGGGMEMVPSADPGDGLLNVFIVSGVSRLFLVTMMPLAYFAAHTRLPGLHFYTCRSVDIEADRPRPIHLDGESGGVRTSLHVSSLSEKLRVIVK